jgi:hypothetical protein
MSQKKQEDAIQDELLTFELAGGELLEEDYLGRSYLFLKDYEPDEPKPNDEKFKYLDFLSAYKLLDPVEYNSKYNNGYIRDRTGCWLISCIADVGNCSGKRKAFP